MAIKVIIDTDPGVGATLRSATLYNTWMYVPRQVADMSSDAMQMTPWPSYQHSTGRRWKSSASRRFSGMYLQQWRQRTPWSSGSSQPCTTPARVRFQSSRALRCRSPGWRSIESLISSTAKTDWATRTFQNPKCVSCTWYPASHGWLLGHTHTAQQGRKTKSAGNSCGTCSKICYLVLKAKALVHCNKIECVLIVKQNLSGYFHLKHASHIFPFFIFFLIIENNIFRNTVSDKNLSGDCYQTVRIHYNYSYLFFS